ncbi:hypothetical protein DAPPUDRAFT_260137 [Daphnia pulex]|uniref:Uncharacterized protein n=1 Tax=Daphnia pulex TaxID=6669 RepID=E9HIK7_DAPPU|nr:hypothetical protein DAPPUDRAFT_260137 [Daphnia pulex]|eukprot:EFX68373.1 hypothetical protein DAPPUDRAFT_260137 [Daphnia pulex]
MALIGAIVGLMLPETLGAILPETIEDGENFGKDQSFWDFPRCQRQKEIEPDTVTASSGDSLPVVAAIDLNLIGRRPIGPMPCGHLSAERPSAPARQRQQRQLDPNDKSHKTNNLETIISSSSAPPPPTQQPQQQFAGPAAGLEIILSNV